MKFRLLFEGAEKRIELLPENSGEQILLGSILDPNKIGDDPTPEAQVSVEVSNDRIPYRKVVLMRITL